MKRCFVDTNVVVYANDRSDPPRQERAIALVEGVLHHRNGVISIQVMQEYASMALGKLSQDASVVLRQLRLLENMIVVQPTADLVRRSVEIHLAYRTSFWDAGILAAAEASHCDLVLSEDLNAGQLYAGIKVINPFAPDFAPAALFS